MTSQFFDMTSTSKFLDVFLDVFLFLLSSLVAGPSFMSISLLVLELWQFSFIRDWPEILKSEIPLSEFFSKSGDWGELWIPNLAQLSLIECYWMLQNSRVIAFTVFELLRENQLGGVKLEENTRRKYQIFLTWGEKHVYKLCDKQLKPAVNNLKSNYGKYHCEWHFNTRH